MTAASWMRNSSGRWPPVWPADSLRRRLGVPSQPCTPALCGPVWLSAATLDGSLLWGSTSRFSGFGR